MGFLRSSAWNGHIRESPLSFLFSSTLIWKVTFRMAPKLHRICRDSEIVEGRARSVEIGERQLALYNISGTFFATDNRCTHARAYLSDGYIEGDTIECPLHGGRFHIPTGQPLSPPVRIPVCVYPVQVIDNEVYIQLAVENEQER